jgi:hypothetical protein
VPRCSKNKWTEGVHATLPQVASMAGSALAGRLLAPSLNVRVERYMQARSIWHHPWLNLSPSAGGGNVAVGWRGPCFIGLSP